MKGFIQYWTEILAMRMSPDGFPASVGMKKGNTVREVTLWRLSETSLQVYDELNAFSDVVLSAQMTNVALFIYACILLL